MASWAAIAKSEPPKAPAVAVVEKEKPTVAVIDANAIINGHGLLNLVRTVEKVVTIPEVLREVRDKQSRATLEALPFTIQTQEPSEESVKAVVNFARATGDLHALSAVDTRLLALTRTIEVNYYGEGHLRDRPPAPRVQKKRVKDIKHLPGWGAEGGDWAEIDRLNEEEEKAAEALLSTAQGNDTSRIAAEVQQLSLDDAAAAVAAASFNATDGNGAAEGHEEDSDSDTEDDEDDEWQVAAKTKNKARRQKRRAHRQAEQAAAAMETLEMEESDSEEEECDSEQGDSEMGDSDVAAGPSHPAGESAVHCITADFAMQNVLLQMGLRLAAPDGRQITTVSRWVLRCSACFQVTKEVGRIFCPRCGNAALDKVRVVVGPDGAEQYGVKKKHVLRGTRFSLPKPKGGRSKDPILREDQLLTKKHLMRAAKAAERAANDQLDPFAPEYNEETWNQRASLPVGNQEAAAALLGGWKHNPNERKHRATNRRRK